MGVDTKAAKAAGTDQVEGLHWGVNLARVREVNSFQSEDGRPIAYVKLEWFGGAATILCEPEDAERFRRYERKFVKVAGPLQYDPAKRKATFGIATLTEVQPS